MYIHMQANIKTHDVHVCTCIYNVHVCMYNVHVCMYNVHVCMYNVHVCMYNVHVCMNSVHIVYWEEFLKLQLLTCLQTRGIAVLLYGQP